MTKKLILVAFAILLGGCMSIPDVRSASTDRLVDVCMNPGNYRQETIDNTIQELGRRGVDCRQIAMQKLMMLQGMRPQPVLQQPYMIPTPQQGYQPAPSGSFGTLIGSTPTTSVSGQSAYFCQYRVGAQTTTVVHLAANGPCPPTANLR